ncbi:sulfatase-like hydrolase/transferase [Wenyingzhuangia sp. 2_MG-2023]|uniref:sulfatase-like hydrolase/transferase n=1 Tax=Wenyingzhuangia sp. 2_MG-2023 TaxID=3062639 RepID=UPI0026E3C673|nr:sulfatase-like hydrolase/transferase [Wenyingzhuangia sp. 2_MG-2023]MDO6736295.1 sulfatase-like hydrolase/transferase [Wenyingzhuangia sp. 2_MG-2023]
MYKSIITVIVLILGKNIWAQKKADTSRPNIIFIYADDMGIGDVSHTTGKAATPNIDRMAAEGIRFTDAHTSSSV